MNKLHEIDSFHFTSFMNCNFFKLSGLLCIFNLYIQNKKFQTNEFESFAPIQVSKNGHSSMIFGVNAYKMDFKNGALSSKKELGTWSVENPKEFNLKPGMTLGGIAAETIYKVVTVIVSL